MKKYNYNQVADELFNSNIRYHIVSHRWEMNGIPVHVSKINYYIRTNYKELDTVNDVAEVRYAFSDIYGVND